MWRRKSVPAWLGEELVPEVHGRLGRNFLKGRGGGKINAILAGAGYNYRLVIKWLGRLSVRIKAAILKALCLPPAAAITLAA
jgi:hypothetical protein